MAGPDKLSLMKYGQRGIIRRRQDFFPYSLHRDRPGIFARAELGLPEQHVHSQPESGHYDHDDARHTLISSRAGYRTGLYNAASRRKWRDMLEKQNSCSSRNIQALANE